MKTPVFDVDYCECTDKHSTNHFHDFYELCYFEHGSRVYLLGDDCYDVYPNCVIMIKPRVQHATKGSENATRTVISFDEEFLSKYFNAETCADLLKVFDDCVKIANADINAIKTLARALRMAFSEKHERQCAFILGQLLDLLKNQRSCEIADENSVNPIIAAVVKYVNENPTDIESVTGIAEKFNISASYLSALFKNAFGISIKQYVIAMRINLAAKKLVATDRDIGEIALECGFSSAAHFSNVFRSRLGVTPMEYKNAYGKG